MGEWKKKSALSKDALLFPTEREQKQEFPPGTVLSWQRPRKLTPLKRIEKG